MILRVPVTATSIIEWVRRAATAINQLITQGDTQQAELDAHQTELDTHDAAITALQTSSASQAADIATLQGQVGQLQITPFLNAVEAPADPVEGQSYYDTTLHKARVWDGTAWNDLW